MTQTDPQTQMQTKHLATSGVSTLPGWVGSAPISVLVAAMLTAGCGSTPTAEATLDAAQAEQQRSAKHDRNRELASLAVRTSISDQDLWTGYSLGGGDVLEVYVFGVEALNTKVRVGRDGNIMLPLIGALNVGAKTPREAESLIRDRLTVYMYEPDVSVYVAEYHSQQVSVSGAVKTPAMHTLTKPRTVLELLSMSGGLTEVAGNQIYVQTKMDNQAQRLIIDINELLSDSGAQRPPIVLAGGDSVFVPEAGVVFVEGAVNAPGSYPLQGSTGVLEAVAMARGTTFDAREADVQVFTSDGRGGRAVVSVPVDQIRANAAPNYVLKDGDIVVVPSNALKRNVAGFWRGFRGIFGMGYSLNGP